MMKKIQRTVNKEDAISRIPGAFAYLEFSEYGGCTLHKASDSPDGCYGKVVEAIEVPVGLTVDGAEIIISGRVYNYREVMNAYYAYRDVVGASNPFVRFVDYGIGKVDLKSYAEENGVTFSDDWYLVPQYIYISQAVEMAMNLRRMKHACIISEKSEENGEPDSAACCICARYLPSGGDDMYGIYCKLADEFIQRSILYYGYSVKGAGRFSLDIQLSGNGKDVGYMTAYEDELHEGDYNEGNIFTHTEYDEDGGISDVKTYYFTKSETVNSDGCNGEIAFDRLSKQIRKPNIGIDDIETKITIDGVRAESRLPSLRSGRRYTNYAGMEISPEEGEDWLWYYKKGLARNIRNNGGADYYGDMITEIVLCDKDGENNQNDHIKFIYKIGAKLEKGNDNNITIDDTYENCLTFTEIYPIIRNESSENDEWGTLIANNNDFETLITNMDGLDRVSDDEDTESETDGGNGGSDGEEKAKLKYEDCRFPFDTSKRTFIIETENGLTTESREAVEGRYNTNVKHEGFNYSSYSELLTSPIFKDDTYMAFPYRADVTDEVHVQRGNGAAYERHIRLSEIKTLDDLMAYSNGGYYTVEQLT